jgi:hypothetical protein
MVGDNCSSHHRRHRPLGDLWGDRRVVVIIVKRSG